MTAADYATKAVITVGPADAIADVIDCMDTHEIHHLPVMDGDQVVGMVSDRDVLLAGGGRSVSAPRAGAVPTRVSQIMSAPVYALPVEATARDAATVMLEQRIGAVVIVDAGRGDAGPRLAGLLTESDLLTQVEVAGRDAGPAQDLLRLPVSEAMTTDVFTVPPKATLDEVLSVLRDKHVRHLPVTAGEDLLGIISDRDLRRALPWPPPGDADVGRKRDDPVGPRYATDIMTRHVITTALYCPLGDVIEIILEKRIHALPVVADEKLLGIVTEADVIRAMIAGEILG